MYQACIAIIDAAHARVYTLARTSAGEDVREDVTDECDLVSPHRHLRQRQSDHRAGRLDADFARSILAEIARQARQAQRLIVCATPHMLGDLRAAGLPHREGLIVDEIARDLANLTPSEVRQQLAGYGVLPPRPVPSMQRVTRRMRVSAV